MIKTKEKKERYLGINLGLKGERCNSPKCALVRRPYKPGMHGKKSKRRRGGDSDYKKQIEEKQKAKLIYGISERTLKRLFALARKKSGNIDKNIIDLLETRLDNVVYRLGIASSRRMARQIISHGHILVNGRKTTCPGLQLKVGDTVSIRPESASKNVFGKLKEKLKDFKVADWLKMDINKLEGTVAKKPEGLDVPFEISHIIELFNK